MRLSLDVGLGSRSAVAAPTGGGWPPENAIAASDFINGRYYGNGQSLTLEESWVASPDFFDLPGSVDARGAGQGLLAATADMLAGLESGFAAVIETDYSQGGVSVKLFAYGTGGFDPYIEFDDNQNGLLYWQDDTNSLQTGNGYPTSGTPRMGITMSAAKVVLSGTNVTSADDVIDGAFSGADLMGGIDGIAWSAAGEARIRSITFYAPMTQAALEALVNA